MRVAHPPPNYNRYRSVMAATEQNLSPPARAPSLAFSLSIDSNPFLYLADKTLHRLVVLLFQGAQKKKGRRIFIIIIVFRGTQALINDELLLEIEIFFGFQREPSSASKLQIYRISISWHWGASSRTTLVSWARSPKFEFVF